MLQWLDFLLDSTLLCLPCGWLPDIHNSLNFCLSFRLAKLDMSVCCSFLFIPFYTFALCLLSALLFLPKLKIPTNDVRPKSVCLAGWLARWCCCCTILYNMYMFAVFTFMLRLSSLPSFHSSIQTLCCCCSPSFRKSIYFAASITRNFKVFFFVLVYIFCSSYI